LNQSNDVSKDFPPQPPLDEIRSAELDQLYAVLDNTRRHRMQILELVGEPGTGKTHLLAELAAEASRRGFSVVRNRCTENRRSALMRAMADLLCSAAVGDPRKGRTAADGGQDACWPGISSSEGRDLLFHAVRELLGSGRSNGMVVIIDDFHWADTNSIEMIEQLIHRPADGPLLVVIAQRPRQASARLRGALAHGVELDLTHRLELASLTLPQSARLLGLEESDPRLRQRHEDAGGVPLYLLALDGLARSGRVPEQVATLLLDEVGQLGPCESLIVAAAAVLDDDWDLETLSAVAGVALERTREVLVLLTERDLFRPTGAGAGHAFRHRLLRRFVYATLSSAWKVAAHRRAKDFLAARGAPAGRLADHVERSLGGPDDDDRRILRQAAREALCCDPAAAAHWLRAALSIIPESEPDDRRETTSLLGRALGMAGRLTESRDVLQEALQLGPADRGGGGRVVTIAFCALIEGLLNNYAEARALLRAELAALGPDDLPVEAVALIIEHEMFAMLAGEPPRPEEVDRAVRLARRHRDEAGEAGALALGGLARALADDLDGAHRLLHESTALADRLLDTAFTARPELLGLLGWAEALAGRNSDAQRHFERAAVIARRCGQAHILPVLLLGQGSTRMNRGRPDEARRVAARAAELAGDIGADHVQGLALTLEGMGAAWTGDAEAARRLVRSADEVLNRRRFHWSAFATFAGATAARLDRDPHRCLMLLREAGGPDLEHLPAVLRPAGFEMLAGAAVEIGATGSQLVDLRRRCESWARQAEQAAAALDRPASSGYAAATRAHALRLAGDRAGATARYCRAVRLFWAAGLTHVQALTLRTLAGLQTGAEADGTRLLAGELAGRSGTAAVVARPGPRPAAPVLPAVAGPAQGLAQLTNREREIAEIAGRGARTREIAERLTLSPRTVDVHLSRIYRKLQIPSRSALARLMADLD
jgi:DNA-binding CsgD family transcriptional regulator/tetratricopeptide (TPR) repeat protein